MKARCIWCGKTLPERYATCQQYTGFICEGQQSRIKSIMVLMDILDKKHERDEKRKSAEEKE